MAKVMKNDHFFGTLPLNTEGPCLDVKILEVNTLGGIKKTSCFFPQITLNKKCPLKINKNAKYFGKGISGTQV